MSACPVALAENTHQRGIEEGAKRDDWIDRRVNELMQPGGGCDPWHEDRIEAALEEGVRYLSIAELRQMTRLAITDKAAAFELISKNAMHYWEEVAFKTACEEYDADFGGKE